MPLDWTPALRHRKGSPNRLEGIDLYYDFDWEEHFRDQRAQFKNGKCLAHAIKSECPSNKTPALILTSQDEVQEGKRETETHYIFVINLPRYLAQGDPDAAASYLVHSLGRSITSLFEVQEVASRPEVIQEVLAEHLEGNLDIERIATWAGNRSERLAQLQELAVLQTDRASATRQQVLAALAAMERLDPEVLSAIESIIGRNLDRDARLRLLRAMTTDTPGRSDAVGVLADRLTDRIDDVLNAASEFDALLVRPLTGETALQSYIEHHPWLVGLEYTRVRPRHSIPRGILDFILERYDGFHDLMELKDPQDPIITAPAATDGVPPPASSFSLSPGLANAIAQAHVYRDALTSHHETTSELFGLENSRNPRVLIVIGQTSNLTPHRANVLRELNMTLHRVEIVAYDELSARARTLLANVRRYLSVAGESA